MTTPLLRLYLLGFIALLPIQSRAADPKPTVSALAKTPASAEYFRSSFRMGETMSILAKSQAWKQILDEPAVKELRNKAMGELTGDKFGPVIKFFADPANAEIPELAADALSQESFVYTGSGTGDILSLLQELIGVARYGPALQQLQGGNADTRARARMLLLMLAEKPERLKMPDFMFGFKVSEPTKVAIQLKRLDPLIAEALKDPQIKDTPFKDCIKRVKVGDDEFLVLSLDGSMIPWDTIPIGDFEEKDGEFAPLVKRLKAMKITISLGVRQDYLLVCIGSTDAILQFGGSGEKLINRRELKPVADAMGKPLLSVGYTSAKLRQSVATTAQDIQGMADMAKGLLALAALPEDVVAGLEKDFDKVAQSIAKSLVKPEATVSYSTRTSRGWESFDYDYSPAGGVTKQPLTLLNHVGGNPIFALVGRSDTTVEDYKAQVKWIATFAGHAEKIARAKSPEAGPVLEMIHKEIYPLLNELNGITEKLFLPALADGQNAIVIDANWKSKKWHEAMPLSEVELPMVQFGLVVGVSDADKLGQALEGYRVTLNTLYATIHKQLPEDKAKEMPLIQIPKPKVDEKKGLTFANYPIPKEWGIDPQFQPTGGISNSVAAVALSRGHVERLLAPVPFTSDLAPFADKKKPLDSLFVMNFAALVTAAEPWVRMALQSAPKGERKEAERIAGKVISMLKMFKSYGSVTWRENGSTITHSEGVVQDLAK
ncbi:hypothetical protein BH11PLA2_BH11PLA2_53280 [soil metagenome]